MLFNELMNNVDGAQNLKQLSFLADFSYQDNRMSKIAFGEEKTHDAIMQSIEDDRRLLHFHKSCTTWFIRLPKYYLINLLLYSFTILQFIIIRQQLPGHPLPNIQLILRARSSSTFRISHQLLCYRNLDCWLIVQTLYLKSIGARNHSHQYSSAGGWKFLGGSPVTGSVSLGLLNSKICGSGLWISQWAHPRDCMMPRDLHSASLISFPLLAIFLQMSLGSMTWRYSQKSSQYLSEYSISAGQ